MNENAYKGLRVITNLSCNLRCKFCYQQDKSGKILPVDTLYDAVKEYPLKSFDYCTIMGGESTLLPNLTDYISIGSVMTKGGVRLTTNGNLLTSNLLNDYESAGLTGINVSIASLIQYQSLTGSKLSTTELFSILEMTKKVFPSLRINIALCEENLGNRNEIKPLLEIFLSRMDLNVTICEDVFGTYSLVDNPDRMASELIEDTGYGLLFFRHRPSGKRFGYYHHSDNYKNTDLIVSPLGIYSGWDKFCEDVGYGDRVVKK